MSLFIIISSILYSFFCVSIIFVVCRRNKKSTENKEINFSIIIAAKNKEGEIKSLIESLTKLHYPTENFEIIIVDDSSTDNTYHLLLQYSKSFANIRIEKIKEKIYAGKKGALQQGIELAKYPFIMITDADCLPGKDWLKNYAYNFSLGYDLLFGIAPYIQNNSFVNKTICFENLRGHILTFFFAKIGLPYSAAARNLGFKKSAFEKVGGYKNTLDTLSGDDDLLIREFNKHNLKIGVVEEKDDSVFTHSKKTFKDFILQRGRHTSSSNYYLLRNKITLFIWHSINILFLFSICYSPFNFIFAIPTFMKLTFDLITIKFTDKKFGYKFNIFEIVFLQIIYEILLIVHFMNSQFRKNKW